MADETCPNCKIGRIEREEVDIGVGVMSGPGRCLHCGWSEQLTEYDLLDCDDKEDESLRRLASTDPSSAPALARRPRLERTRAMDNPPTLEQQLVFIARELLGWLQDRDGRWKHVDGNTERWPSLQRLLSADGMLEIVEAMRKRKFRARLEALDEPVLTLPFLAAFDPPKSMNTTHDGDTLPEAVVRAAFEALFREDK